MLEDGFFRLWTTENGAMCLMNKIVSFIGGPLIIKDTKLYLEDLGSLKTSSGRF